MNTWWAGKEERAGLFSVVPSDRTRSNRHSLKNRECCKPEKTFLNVRVTEHWKGLPRQAVEIFKTQLDTVRGNLLQWSLLEQELEQGLDRLQRCRPNSPILCSAMNCTVAV